MSQYRDSVSVEYIVEAGMAPEPESKDLRRRIRECEAQLDALKCELAAVESNCPRSHAVETQADEQKLSEPDYPQDSGVSRSNSGSWPLELGEYSRYGRQLIMPEIGITGQLKLKATSVLVVGVGGLGCPAAAYLAGAGVGTIGLVDGDTVDESNLHRQILHTTGRIGQFKVDSATEFLQALNPNVRYVSHSSHLQAESALRLCEPYDLVLDCTDNPASRYLISDVCVLLGKCLVSASALRTDGQLMVFNDPPHPPGNPTGGPCYRCMFPRPPPPESIVTCGDGGILGPVVGVMGVLQALEAIKLVTSRHAAGMHHSSGLTGASSTSREEPQTALLFSANSKTPFRSFKMGRRRKNCATCSSQASVTRASLTSGSLDYVQFCGLTNPVNILSPGERILAEEYAKMQPLSSITIDTREAVQFAICNLKNSINVPFSQISSLRKTEANSEDYTENNPEWLQQLYRQPQDKPIFVVCRLGNDSQLAVRKFKELGLDCNGKREIRDIKGGLRAWRASVDNGFPDY